MMKTIKSLSELNEEIGDVTSYFQSTIVELKSLHFTITIDLRGVDTDIRKRAIELDKKRGVKKLFQWIN